MELAVHDQCRDDLQALSMQAPARGPLMDEAEGFFLLDEAVDVRHEFPGAA